MSALGTLVAGMGGNPPRMSWRRFWLLAALVTAVVVPGTAYLISRYHIGIDPQRTLCLDRSRIVLIDTHDKTLVRGGTYAFKASGLKPLFADGTTMGKVVAGIPGDEVAVKDGVVRINGEVVSEGMPVAQKIRRSVESFDRSFTLGPGRYWMMGTHPLSFDSRYWGTIGTDQIIGRAYRLF